MSAITDFKRSGGGYDNHDNVGKTPARGRSSAWAALCRAEAY